MSTLLEFKSLKKKTPHVSLMARGVKAIRATVSMKVAEDSHRNALSVQGLVQILGEVVFLEFISPLYG
ncbi:hypothetical protein HS1genome_0868 [Sulfodiicoccus acidiphilus]|uniref:Uncharacterized protein n=1 Tax=Sulfodiicoccus acidiphilus TaxID=1670455 RepID=A0A348B2S7_9CREN|nr:hypothetical protein HS1genome_0868 [Sulfodiicoccus acidiphilus]GGT96833.1 hypothetical protein GCM10007116_12910 [Sulfodiicoccus acidiphilus]